MTPLARTLLISIASSLSTLAAYQAYLYLKRRTLAQLGQPLEFTKHYHGCIYLDWNATTPVFPQVAQAMRPYLSTRFGNPGSSHAFARPCALAIQHAREQVASLLHCTSVDEVVFTSCGSESNNTAIRLALRLFRHKSTLKPHIVTSSVEHPSVLQLLRQLCDQGECTLGVVPCDPHGRVRATDVFREIEQHRPHVALVTIMHSNNETGALMPVQEISQFCRTHDVLFHTDAAQSVSKVPVDIQSGAFEPDMLTLVGHKFGCPKGVAALYISKRVTTGVDLGHQQLGLIVGGGQEHQWRAGTSNVLLIVGLGVACAIAKREQPRLAAHTSMLKQRMLDHLITRLGTECVRINGPQDVAHTLPNTLNVGIKVNGKTLVSRVLIDRLAEEVAFGAGSACHAGGTSMSPVLAAMGTPPEWGLASMRLSFGRHTTVDDVDRAAKLILDAAELLVAEEEG